MKTHAIALAASSPIDWEILIEATDLKAFLYKMLQAI